MGSMHATPFRRAEGRTISRLIGCRGFTNIFIALAALSHYAIIKQLMARQPNCFLFVSVSYWQSNFSIHIRIVYNRPWSVAETLRHPAAVKFRGICFESHCQIIDKRINCLCAAEKRKASPSRSLRKRKTTRKSERFWLSKCFLCADIMELNWELYKD